MSSGDGAITGFEAFRNSYFEECGELLEALYHHLSVLEQGEHDEETIHAVFRAVHSIKGGGGAFGLTRLVGFAHVLETLLDMLRDGRIKLQAAIVPLMLRSSDMLADLVAAARTGSEPPAGVEDSLLRELKNVSEPGGNAPAEQIGRAHV